MNTLKPFSSKWKILLLPFQGQLLIKLFGIYSTKKGSGNYYR